MQYGWVRGLGTWIGWLLLTAACAATPDTLRISQLPSSVLLRQHALLTITDPGATWAQARQQRTWQRPPNSLTTTARQAYWFWFSLQNDTRRPQTRFVFGGQNEVVRLYVQTDTRTDSMRMGDLIPSSQWPLPENQKYAPLQLAPGQTTAVWVGVGVAQGWLPRLTSSPLPRPRLNLRLMDAAGRNEQLVAERHSNAVELQNRSWVEGALFFFLILVLFFLARYPQRLYGYYALYVLSACVYALLKSRPYTVPGRWIAQLPWLQAHLLDPVLWMGWGAYLYFLIELLNLRQMHPAAARRIRWIGRVALAYSLLYAALLLLTNDGGLQQIGFWASRVCFATAHIVILVWTVWAVRSPLTRYVLVGNLLLTGVAVTAALMQGGLLTDDLWLIAALRNLMMVSFAVLLEIMVFGLALAYRIQLIDHERQRTQTAYLEEIEQRNSYEKRIAEVEMLALRSQMNPHFLFNSLNTIEYFVLKNDEEKASRYLSSFSRLLRLILNHSNEETVSLADELTGLRLYLELEATRFGDEFRYTIEVDADVAQEEVLLPPLLLQPFVENAIWHGLRQSQRTDKRLWIRVLMQDGQTLRLEVEDNGIGRQRAADLRSRSATQRKSYGMAITQQRIDLFNRNYAANLDVQLIDIEQQNQTGTLVRMTYKTSRQYESNSNR
jgi:two-component sensor histidine kinase